LAQVVPDQIIAQQPQRKGQQAGANEQEMDERLTQKSLQRSYLASLCQRQQIP
jgi:hypothetical protein